LKEKDCILVEKQRVDLELARLRLHEQEEGAATEAAGEEDEIKALRRRLTYWRRRDKARDEVPKPATAPPAPSLLLSFSLSRARSLFHTHTHTLSDLFSNGII